MRNDVATFPPLRGKADGFVLWEMLLALAIFLPRCDRSYDGNATFRRYGGSDS